MEWNLDSAARALYILGETEKISLRWRLKTGWFTFRLMWEGWNAGRERECKKHISL